MRIQLSKTSFLHDDEFTAEFDFNNSPIPIIGLSNISISIYRIDIERDYFIVVFGHRPDAENGKITIKRKLPESCSEGIYQLKDVKLFYGDDESNPIRISPMQGTPQIYFWISNSEKNHLTITDLSNKIIALPKLREEFNNKTLTTIRADQHPEKCKIHRILFFAVGCLVHNQQNLEGYTIYPLSEGFDYIHMHRSVDNFLKNNYGFSIPYEESIAEKFSQSTPIFVIEFKNVFAEDHNDAIFHCTEIAENLFTILSFEKGQRPNKYATISISQTESIYHQEFNFPGYSGNTISSFSPSSTSESIESILPLMINSPWITLLMHSLGEALSEKNQNFAYLKFWAILELVAKKKIKNDKDILKYPNGSQIFLGNGEPVKTKDALGKVYILLLKSKVPPMHVNLNDNKRYIFETYQDINDNKNVDEQTEVFQLWDVLRAAYAIRNSTAHSGTFNPHQCMSDNEIGQLASRLYLFPHSLFLRNIRNIAKFIVSLELKEAHIFC